MGKTARFIRDAAITSLAALTVVGIHLLVNRPPKPPPGFVSIEPTASSPRAAALRDTPEGRLYDVRDLRGAETETLLKELTHGPATPPHQIESWAGRLYVIATPEEHRRIENCLTALRWLELAARGESHRPQQ